MDINQQILAEKRKLQVLKEKILVIEGNIASLKKAKKFKEPIISESIRKNSSNLKAMRGKLFLTDYASEYLKSNFKANNHPSSEDYSRMENHLKISRRRIIEKFCRMRHQQKNKCYV